VDLHCGNADGSHSYGKHFKSLQEIKKESVWDEEEE
jgi:hypothetical protein